MILLSDEGLRVSSVEHQIVSMERFGMLHSITHGLSRPIKKLMVLLPLMHP